MSGTKPVMSTQVARTCGFLMRKAGGNERVIGKDGTRDEVCDWYKEKVATDAE